MTHSAGMAYFFQTRLKQKTVAARYTNYHQLVYLAKVIFWFGKVNPQNGYTLVPWWPTFFKFARKKYAKPTLGRYMFFYLGQFEKSRPSWHLVGTCFLIRASLRKRGHPNMKVCRCLLIQVSLKKVGHRTTLKVSIMGGKITQIKKWFWLSILIRR